VLSGLALKALEVYAIPTPWRHQDTTTIALYGAYEGGEEPSKTAAKAAAGLVAPRLASGYSKEGGMISNRCCLASR
jgi:hypothetical protein